VHAHGVDIGAVEEVFVGVRLVGLDAFDQLVLAQKPAPFGGLEVAGLGLGGPGLGGLGFGKRRAVRLGPGGIRRRLKRKGGDRRRRRRDREWVCAVRAQYRSS